MDVEILDASAIDGLDDYNLTGEQDDIVEQEHQSENHEENHEENSEENQQQNSNENLESNLNNQDNENDDFTLLVLRLKGITDPSKIKFEDESGAIIERDWNSLTAAEQLNIITSNEDPERDLEEDEILLINTLRENLLTPQQYIKAIQDQAAKHALELYQQQQLPIYEVDSLSDDELFALDLLLKVGEENITDDELKEALENAKSNMPLFEKQIEGLRALYKNLEDLQKYEADQAQIEMAEQLYQDFADKVLNEIHNFDNVANLEVSLSTDDKNDIANYLLTRRETGISDFYSDMQDPATATLAAFWLLQGPAIINEMENEIKAAYQRGFTLGKLSVPLNTPKTSQVVILPKQNNSPKNEGFQSAFGLEDESYLN